MEKKERVTEALTQFVERTSKESATAAETEALPAVAEVLLRYFSSGVLDSGTETTDCADSRFLVIPDDETQSLTICPTEEQYTAIRLDKSTAKILVDTILRQIQKW